MKTLTAGNLLVYGNGSTIPPLGESFEAAGAESLASIVSSIGALTATDGGDGTFGTPAFGGSYDSLDTRGTITITTDGTVDFTSKANAAPLYYIDPGVEGSLTSSPLSRRTAPSLTTTGALDTEMCMLPGGSARAQLLGGGGDNRLYSGSVLTNSEFVTDVDHDTTHTRIFARRRKDFDGLDAYNRQVANNGAREWNLKGWRYYARKGEGGNNLVISVGQSLEPSGNPRITPEYTDSSYQVQGTQEAQQLIVMAKDMWCADFIDVRASSAPNVSDALWRFYGNGVLVGQFNFVSRDTEADGLYRLLHLEQCQFIYMDEANFWYDVVYVDDTAHAVVITDQPEWGMATDAEGFDLAIPTAWSPTEITVRLRGPATGGRYLYVFDGNGDCVNPGGNGVALGGA